MVRDKAQHRDAETGLILIDRPEEVPDFATEAEELAFWDTHAFSEQFWAETPPVDDTELPPVDLSQLAPAERAAWRGMHPHRRVQE